LVIACGGDTDLAQEEPEEEDWIGVAAASGHHNLLDGGEMSTITLERTTPDYDAAEAFAERVGTMLDAGATAAIMSLGHRLGLFDKMAELPPSTSVAIADHAKLAERNVREWLAVMVTSGVVTYDPATRCYLLPTEHAACLTRMAPP
jgi:hypothetical protein